MYGKHLPSVRFEIRFITEGSTVSGTEEAKSGVYESSVTEMRAYDSEAAAR